MKKNKTTKKNIPLTHDTKKKKPLIHHPIINKIKIKKNIKKIIHAKTVKNIKKSSNIHKVKTAKAVTKKILNKHITKNALPKHIAHAEKRIVHEAKKPPVKHAIKKAVLKTKKKTVNNDVTEVKDDIKNIKTPEIKIDTKSPKRVIIVHGWDGDINKGWFPWIKKELETQGFKVIMERMPNPGRPQIDEWIGMLKSLSGNIDERTYFIGHSIGCQTIMRMLEKIESEKIGGAVFLAGWFDLTEHTYKENPKMEKEMRRIAEPWISTRFDLYKVKSKFLPGTVTAIFSEDDPYVDLKNAEAFKEWLDARIIIENGKGHFEEAKISEMPLLIEEILRISKESEETK